MAGFKKAIQLIRLLPAILLHLVADLWRWLTQREKSVKGQTVVITGGAQGIGSGLARLFALKLGSIVVLPDINKVRALP